MQKVTSFFWFCSGADIPTLEKCPTESSKYVGIGATVFFTGLFAALSAGYALYSVFDNVWTAAFFGLVWGLMIFNLDRYIVSSMRKEGRASREIRMAVPRILLAIIISIVIARPLELKIFEKEIQPELVVMEQQKSAEQQSVLKAKYTPQQDSIKVTVQRLKNEIATSADKRDELAKIAQEEADGTGGSKRRNLGPIYKVKKADADRAEEELNQITQNNQLQISELEKQLSESNASMSGEIASLEKIALTGPAARMEALDRLTAQSSAIAWAHWFILLLFISIETAPVFVKLISSKGPYDNLLKIEEHGFRTREIEEVARTNAGIKEKNAALSQHERSFITEKLDTELNRF
jgi:hypothetical protein